ncbi:glucosamine-6-phosphate isomerase, partial [bacterium]|nr:glucosamine-6-phosphate isomerase [bacterium]
MNLLTTLSNSLMQGFFPKGWDLAKIDGLAEVSGADLLSKKSWWNPEFKPIPCQNLGDFDVYMGHEIAIEISNARKNGRELAMILPVGPMG